MDLDFDPKTKSQIKQMLYEYIYSPVAARFEKRLLNIIRRNQVATKNTAEAFRYRTEVYGKAQPTFRVPRLDASLHADMNAYLEDLEKLNQTELPFVLGYLNQVLNSSNTLQDYLLLLPDSIHQPIKDLIDQCGCRTTKLSADEVARIIAANNLPIEMLKQRLVLNLLE